MLGGLGYINTLDIQGSNYFLRELKIKDANNLVRSQWVLGYLTEVDLLLLFVGIRQSFIAGSHFVIKENITSSREVEKDDEDSSVARPLKMYETCLKQTGFRIVKLARSKLPLGMNLTEDKGVRMTTPPPPPATLEEKKKPQSPVATNDTN
ncbi:alpha N-terminal protein methyltransferase 1-like [Glossina fuscipes]|uniref:Alpha N-terminal protein methyltransferase 1 n=1 Tax=Glossina fuscipes TaxID=7396 RepID=A0A9C6E0J4_9MUSC|nr:alpha N-terminal protein methyltransferase 1-like [Glossina fuscipes]